MQDQPLSRLVKHISPLRTQTEIRTWIYATDKELGSRRPEVNVIDEPDICINLLYSVFDFVECIRWGKAEFEYEPVHLVNDKGDQDNLL